MLNREYKPTLGLWNGVGGKIEGNETPLECVIREVKEEQILTSVIVKSLIRG